MYPKDLNYPAFFAMEKLLKAKYPKAVIYNPARNHPAEVRRSWVWNMRRDVKKVAQADMVVFLFLWEASRGARLEYRNASELELMLVDENFNPVDKNMSEVRITWRKLWKKSQLKIRELAKSSKLVL